MSKLVEADTKIIEQATSEFADVSSEADVEAMRVKYLGRKNGLVQARFDALKSAAPADKRSIGQSANILRTKITEMLNEAKKNVGASGGGGKKGATFDTTLPGQKQSTGYKHVLSQTTELLVGVASTLGFSVAEGPEVELESNNFDALNIPLEHPSYDPFDTIYVDTPEDAPKMVMRSHTSPVQVRVMAENAPNPVRVVVPGRTYRPDKVDATHYHSFHQMEGLAVDTDITFQDLKYTLSLFAQGVFGSDVTTRFRPSYFPFTEPSAEVDVSCPFCARDGSACSVCKATGWIEILGCGMVHPNVLTNAGYDPEVHSGFAFGMGIERVAMLRHDINDIRLFIDPERGNDLRFSSQF